MSLPSFGTFEVFRGDQFVRRLVIKEAGVVKDITGWKLRFVAKAFITDPDTSAVIFKDLVLTDPDAGEATLTLTTDDTDIEPATYPATIQILTGTGNLRSIEVGLVVAARAAVEGI